MGIRKIVVGMMVVGMLGIGIGSSETKSEAKENLQPQIAQKILRFHVLANSDSGEDQNLKLEVRDCIGNYLNPILENSDSLEESKYLVEEKIPEIEKLAEEYIVESGYNYKVSAKIEEIDFPEKTYGEYTFPEGTYEALEVSIGEAKGQNWWCVLYPNMCFQGTVYEAPTQEAEGRLKEVLTTEEYEEVFSGENYQIKWKFLEEIEVFLDRLQGRILSSSK